MTGDLLLALQLGDSAYPSGAFGFSWGLEGAIAEGHVDRASFSDWLAVEMLQRWARFDKPVLNEAWKRTGDDLLDWDCEVDLLFWAEPLRQRSVEAGAAFLAAASRMDVPVARDLLLAKDEGQAHGHLPVAQGAVYTGMGLPLNHALATSAYAAAQGLASAAVRLGLISAFDGQRALTDVRPALAEAAQPRTELPSAFAPISEIVMLRPADGRLFVN